MFFIKKSYQYLKKWINQIILFEQVCIFCGAKAQKQFCNDCYHSLYLNKSHNYCPCCLIYFPPKEIICQNCTKYNFAFERIISAYDYIFPLNKVLHQLKYFAKLEYSTALSQLFYLGISKKLTSLPDIIIPVPLHPRKHRQRGFNQVLELLRVFNQIHPDILQLRCIRSIDTIPQANLNRAKRILNLRNAFKITASLQNKHIVIVDDVVTSGTTVNELALLCKKAGAKKIEVWCLMRVQ